MTQAVHDNAELVAAWIREHGPIPAVRISSARTGSSCPWSYWDAVNYEIVLREDGVLAARPLEAARRCRRSYAAALSDAMARETLQGRVLIVGFRGSLGERDLTRVAAWVRDRLAGKPLGMKLDTTGGEWTRDNRVVWRDGRGRLHREDGPAEILLATGTQRWLRHGRLHRTDGPAVIRQDGTTEWWIGGKPLDPLEVLVRVAEGKEGAA